MWKLSVKLDEDEKLNEDVKAVFRDIADQYEKLILNGPPPLGYKEIEIVHWGKYPLCAINDLPEKYKIYLKINFDNSYYLQKATYQFSHELCHIYCNPLITNRFIESICEMSSLYFLVYLGEKWQENPPYPNWKNDAQKFSEYKSEVIKSIDNNLGEYSDIKNIIKYTKDLGSEKERNLQRITAEKLLTIFQQDSRAWLLLADFGKFSKPQPPPDEYHKLCGIEGIDFNELLNSDSVSIESKEIIKTILEVVKKSQNL